MKSTNLWCLLILIISFSSCFREDEYIFPPEALNVPNLDNLQENVFSTIAVDINNNGTIIGYSGSSNSPLFRSYDFPSTAFIIEANNTGVKKISPDSLYCTWPLAINDHGLIAGAFLPSFAGKASGNELVNLPAFAFIYNLQSGAFNNIHQNQFKLR